MPHTNQSPAREHPAVRAAREIVDSLTPEWHPHEREPMYESAAVSIRQHYAERDARVLKALEAAQDRLNVAIEEHPCWAGGFSATEGVVPNWCERCFPIHVTALQVRAAIAELKGE